MRTIVGEAVNMLETGIYNLEAFSSFKFPCANASVKSVVSWTEPKEFFAETRPNIVIIESLNSAFKMAKNTSDE